MKSQRKHSQTPLSVKIHDVHVPTRGICNITDEQALYDIAEIKSLLSQATSKDMPVDRAHALIPLFEYIDNYPCILFLNPRLLDIVTHKVEELVTEITNKQNHLQEYFDAADRMSAALSYSQREIGHEILREGMKRKTEEWDALYDLKSVLMELSEILPLAEPSTKCAEPSVPACCPHSKKIENK
jgi:hypothetical protein